jgi:peptidoglycan/xylan/chitin deacetylase (PgdA/CDA1 family)
MTIGRGPRREEPAAGWRQRLLSRRAALAAGVAAIVAACTKSSKASPPSSPATAPEATAAPTTATPAPGPTTAPPTTPPPAASTAPAGPARFVDAGPRDRPQVALTFHASGDVGLAQQLLDVLAQHSTFVTVFVVGQWLEQNPTMAKAIEAAGHELGNHTYTHPALGQVPRSSVAQEIAGCAKVLTAVTGNPGRWFRPSGIAVPTATILAEAGRAGYGVSVGYDVDSLDFEDPGSKAVIANTMAAVKPGSIVSLHFGHSGTVQAMPTLLARLASAGLKPVTLSELLA